MVESSGDDRVVREVFRARVDQIIQGSFSFSNETFDRFIDCDSVRSRDLLLQVLLDLLYSDVQLS